MHRRFVVVYSRHSLCLSNLKGQGKACMGPDPHLLGPYRTPYHSPAAPLLPLSCRTAALQGILSLRGEGLSLCAQLMAERLVLVLQQLSQGAGNTHRWGRGQRSGASGAYGSNGTATISNDCDIRWWGCETKVEVKVRVRAPLLQTASAASQQAGLGWAYRICSDGAEQGRAGR